MNWVSNTEQQQQRSSGSSTDQMNIQQGNNISSNSQADRCGLTVPKLNIVTTESSLSLAPATPSDQNVPVTPSSIVVDDNAATLATPKNSDTKFFSSPSVNVNVNSDNIGNKRNGKEPLSSRNDSGRMSLCSNKSNNNNRRNGGMTVGCSTSVSSSSESQLLSLSDQNVPVTPKNSEDDIMKSFSISPLMSLRELQLRSGGSTPGLSKQYMRKGGSVGYRCSPYMYHRGGGASPMTNFLNRSESPLSRSASGRSLSSSFSSSSSLSYSKTANRSLVYDRPYSWPSKGSAAVYHQQQQRQHHKKQLFPTSTLERRHHRGMSASPSPIAFSRTSKDLMAPRSRVSPVSALSKSPYAPSSEALYGGRVKSSMAWRSSTDAFRFEKERSVFKSHDNIGSSYNDLLPSPLK